MVREAIKRGANAMVKKAKATGRRIRSEMKKDPKSQAFFGFFIADHAGEVIESMKLIRCVAGLWCLLNDRDSCGIYYGQLLKKIVIYDRLIILTACVHQILQYPGL